MRSGVVLSRFVAGEAMIDRARSIQCRTYWRGEGVESSFISLERGIVLEYVCR